MQFKYKIIIIIAIILILYSGIASAVEFNQSFKLSSSYILGSHTKRDQAYWNYSVINLKNNLWGRFTKVSSVNLYGQYYTSVGGWWHDGLTNMGGGILDEEEFKALNPPLQRVGGQRWTEDHMGFLLKLERITPRPEEVVPVEYVFVMY